MTWLRLDDQIADHPKFITAGPQAAWLWLCGLAYASRYLTDGFVPSVQVARLGSVKGALKLAERLVAVGLWERAEGGFLIHDYHDYQPSAQQIKDGREAARRRKKGGPVRPDSGRNPAGIRPESGVPLARARVGAGPVPSGELRSPTPSHSRPKKTTPERESPGGEASAAADDPQAKANGADHRAKGTNLGPLLDAFTALGLPRPTLTQTEVKSAGELLRHFDPATIAACWQDIAAGEWGDAYSRRELSFGFLSRNNRLGNWQRDHQAREQIADDLVGDVVVERV